MKKSNYLHFDLAARIDYGVKKGAANARLQHKLAGKPIYVMEKGIVVAIPADEIQVNDVEPGFEA